jgi:hypothetical protein
MEDARHALAALALAACFPADAMTFRAEPPFLYLGGNVTATDWAAWEEAFIRFDGRIDTIVLHQSPGGDSATGRRIGQSIRDRGLKTVVAGRCVSACANMFLGGTSRQFAASTVKVPPTLGYHGSYNRKTKEVNRKKTGDYFVTMTGGRMSEEIIERFIRIENKNGMLYFVHPEQRRTAGAPLALLCRGDEDRARREDECERVGGVDALSTGVVTSWELRGIPVPSAPSKLKTTVKSWD